MNSVQPRADLSHPQIHRHTAAMPSRSPRASQPRNLTGLFLGTGKTVQPPPPSRCSAPSQYSKSARAMPSRRSRTPTEERRYNADLDYSYILGSTCDESYATECDYIPCTVPQFPLMPPSRYPLRAEQKKVEMLRAREERRGFSGNLVKSHQRGLSTGETEMTNAGHSGRNDFWDMTKQTNRQFTAANNSGVSHLEYLAPDPDGAVQAAYPSPFHHFLDDTLTEEIQLANQHRKQAVGLIHCYNKICKGNRDAVFSLLPNRRSQNIADASSRTTGFSVSAKALLEWSVARSDYMYKFRWKCIFIPDNGAFFVNYVITSAFIGTAAELVRIPELVMYAIKLACARSAAERTSVRKAVMFEFQFGVQYAWMLCVFTVTIAYSIPCPLITPFGLLYIVMKHMVDRYNIYFAFAPSKIDKNIHASAINFVIISAICLQITVLFFTILRADNLHSIAIFAIVALFLTMVVFFGRICFGWFKGLSPIKYKIVHETSEDGTSAAATDHKPFIPSVLLEEAGTNEIPEVTGAASGNSQSYGTADKPPVPLGAEPQP